MTTTQRLVDIIAEHGDGNDIIEFGKLVNSAGKGAKMNMPWKPKMQFSEKNSSNLYDSLGFNPANTFRKVHNAVEKHQPTNHIEFIKAVITDTDQETIEQLAALMLLVKQELPPFIVLQVLGGRPG